MFQDLINPAFPKENLKKLTEIVERYVSPRSADDFSEGNYDVVLQSLLTPFSEEQWEGKVFELVERLADEAKKNKSETPHYEAALRELLEHMRYLKEKNSPNELKSLLILVNSSYHLSFYEASMEASKEVGALFKDSLAENVDPKTRGQGSLAGYRARLKQQIGFQLMMHEDDIKQKVTAEHVKRELTLAATKVDVDVDESNIVKPTSPAITPLKSGEKESVVLVKRTHATDDNEKAAKAKLK